MANGNSYPAVQLDAKGNVVDSGTVIQFTDSGDEPGTGGGGGLPTGWTQSGNPADVDGHSGSLAFEQGTDTMSLNGANLASSDSNTGASAQFGAVNGAQSAPPTGTPAFLAAGTNGATVALDAGGLSVEMGAGAVNGVQGTQTLAANANGVLVADSATSSYADMDPAAGVSVATAGSQPAFTVDPAAGGSVALDAGGLAVDNVGTLTAATVDATTAALTPGTPGDDVLFCNGGAITGFSAAVPNVVPAITGALSTVIDAAAKDVLTSLIAALVGLGLVTDGTT